MGTQEILTLQFGHYANFVGTHWWNLQETGFEYTSSIPSEINHDVLFREGHTNQGLVTFTPRLLLVDLKGSLKSLPEQGELYESIPGPSKVHVEWDEHLVQMLEDKKEMRNEFLDDLRDTNDDIKINQQKYDFEKDVKVWSDFLYTRFHPRTVNIIKGYQFSSDSTPFDIFPLGCELWKHNEFQDGYTDKIRNYIEECDSFQGFHILTDSTNAFSGLSTSCIEYLHDEYDRKPVLVFPLIPSHFPDNSFKTDDQKHQSIINDSIRVLNLGFCYNSLAEHSSLFVPLSTGSKGWRQPGIKREFYHTVYNHELPYHSSAILACALDTLTLKHRLKLHNFSLVDLCADLNANGRKVAAASVCLPFSINSDADLLDCLDNWEGPLTQSITPSCSIGNERMLQHISMRGIPENRLKRPPQQADKQRDLPAYKCNSVAEMLQFYLSCTTYATVSKVSVVQKPLVVRTPFPRIFDPYIDINGNVCASSRSDEIAVDNVPVVAGLHSGEGLGDMLESLHTEMKKIKFCKFHQFMNEGIDLDKYNDCLDNLFDLRENYENKYLI